MPQIEHVTNGKAFNLLAPLLAVATTLAPPSYAGYPTTGQFRLVARDNGEIMLVTDASIHPWPLARAQEGTTAIDHAAQTLISQQLTAGAFDDLVGADQAGTLVATGRELDFASGFVVTQAGDKIQVDLAAPGFQTLTDAATIAWDLSLGSGQVTITASRLLGNPTNLVAGAFFALAVIQGGVGSFVLTYDTAYQFASGTAPTLTTTAGAKDLLLFVSDGTALLLLSTALDVS